MSVTDAQFGHSYALSKKPNAIDRLANRQRSGGDRPGLWGHATVWHSRHIRQKVRVSHGEVAAGRTPDVINDARKTVVCPLFSPIFFFRQRRDIRLQKGVA